MRRSPDADSGTRLTDDPEEADRTHEQDRPDEEEALSDTTSELTSLSEHLVHEADEKSHYNANEE